MSAHSGSFSSKPILVLHWINLLLKLQGLTKVERSNEAILYSENGQIFLECKRQDKNGSFHVFPEVFVFHANILACIVHLGMEMQCCEFSNVML